MLLHRFGTDVFTVADAERAGVSQRRLRIAAAAGAIEALAGGTYYVPDPGMDARERYLRRVSAVRRDRDDVVVAGVSAAAWWGVRCPQRWGDWSDLPVCIASPRRVKASSGLICLALGRRSITRLDGVPVTDLETTAADVARHLPAPEALIAVDDIARRMAATSDRHRLAREAVREGLRARLAGSLELHPRPNARRARRTLSWADPATDSAPESYLRGHLLLAGLPAPVVNARLMGASGRRYYVDLYWPQQNLAVEIDGRIKYEDLGVLYREKVRQEDLQAAGLIVVRWLAEDVAAFPEHVVERLQSLL